MVGLIEEQFRLSIVTFLSPTFRNTSILLWCRFVMASITLKHAPDTHHNAGA